MSEWVARVQPEWAYGGVNVVWVRDSFGGGREVSNGTTGWVITEGAAAPANVEPLRLREDMLRALHQELLRFFDGADDARALRKDYDAERARVDKLTDAIIGRMK